MKTDRLLADTKTIRYEETDLASLISAPYHFRCGIYLICTQGEAVVSTGVQKYIFNEQTELIFLTGGLLQVLETSGDLQVKMLMFPKEAFLNAMLPIDTPYFNYTHELPVTIILLTNGVRRPGGRSICGWIWHKCCLPNRCPSSGDNKSTTFCKVCLCGCLIRFRKNWLSVSNIVVRNYFAIGLCN